MSASASAAARLSVVSAFLKPRRAWDQHPTSVASGLAKTRPFSPAQLAAYLLLMRELAAREAAAVEAAKIAAELAKAAAAAQEAVAASPAIAKAAAASPPAAGAAAAVVATALAVGCSSYELTTWARKKLADRAARRELEKRLKDLERYVDGRGPRNYSKKQREAKFQELEGKCEYCGQETQLEGGSPNSFEADHRQPYSADGETTDENLAGSCRSCNREKGPKPLKDPKDIGPGWVPPLLR